MPAAVPCVKAFRPQHCSRSDKGDSVGSLESLHFGFMVSHSLEIRQLRNPMEGRSDLGLGLVPDACRQLAGWPACRPAYEANFVPNTAVHNSMSLSSLSPDQKGAPFPVSCASAVLAVCKRGSTPWFGLLFSVSFSTVWPHEFRDVLQTKTLKP